MKALQIKGPGEYTVVEIPVPEVQAHQALVEIKLAATCPRWDIHMLSGKDMFDASKSPDYPLPPGFPGHEITGVVKAVGANVKHLQVGDRVAALEHLAGNGAYAQYLCYQEQELIKLPEHISYRQAVSFELLKCVLIGLLQFDSFAGKSVLVSGLGPAGMLAIQAAKLMGAKRVVGVDLSESRVDYVNKLGIGEALLVRDLGEQRFDFGYDCVGYNTSVQKLLEHTDKHLVIFGVLKGAVSYPEHLWMKGFRLESYQYRAFGEQDRELLLDLVGSKGLNTECLQTHNVPFTRYHEVVELLQKQEAIKVYFEPEKDFA